MSGGEEDTGASGRPATVRQVLGVRAGTGTWLLLLCPSGGPGPHDGALLDVLGPDPGTPVTHRQEVLTRGRITVWSGWNRRQPLENKGSSEGRKQGQSEPWKNIEIFFSAENL